MPNGLISTGSLILYSKEPLSRVDLTFGIAYGDDVEKLKRAINDFIKEVERILTDLPHFIGLANSSVNFVV